MARHAGRHESPSRRAPGRCAGQVGAGRPPHDRQQLRARLTPQGDTIYKGGLARPFYYGRKQQSDARQCSF